MLTNRLLILPIALAKVQANGNLLNEIRQIIYSLYQAKEITKKVYNNMMDSIIIQNGYYAYL